MTDTRDEHVTLEVADGTRMDAFVAMPPAEHNRGGILLLQEAFGVNEHIRNVAQRFARAGYVTIAPELYHREAPGFESGYEHTDPALAEMGKLTDGGLEQDVAAAHGWLTGPAELANDQIVSVGFCLGGYVSFLANSVLPLAGAVCFYGGRMPQLLDRVDKLSGPLLLFWGDRDGSIGPDDRDRTIRALHGAGKTFTHVLFSDAGHGFFCDRRASYHETAAHQAWPMTLAFLGQYLQH